MLRLIGAILVAGGTTGAGLGAVYRLNGRVKAVSSLIAALELMRAEMDFRLTPLPELMTMLAKNAPSPAGGLFKSCAKAIGSLADKPFSQIWDKAVTEYCTAEQIGEVKPVLTELGMVLGRYDCEAQSRAIIYACKRLEERLTEAREEKTRQGKVFGVLGVVAGIAIIIVLI